MKVGHVTERQRDIQAGSVLDSDEMDRAGIDLGATGRLQLMAKLAEGKIQSSLYSLSMKLSTLMIKRIFHRVIVRIGKVEPKGRTDS